MKTPEQRPWHRSGAPIVNFENISDIVLIVQISIVDFEQVNAGSKLLTF